MQWVSAFSQRPHKPTVKCISSISYRLLSLFPLNWIFLCLSAWTDTQRRLAAWHANQPLRKGHTTLALFFSNTTSRPSSYYVRGVVRKTVRTLQHRRIWWDFSYFDAVTYSWCLSRFYRHLPLLRFHYIYLRNRGTVMVCVWPLTRFVWIILWAIDKRFGKFLVSLAVFAISLLID